MHDIQSVGTVLEAQARQVLLNAREDKNDPAVNWSQQHLVISGKAETIFPVRGVPA